MFDKPTVVVLFLFRDSDMESNFSHVSDTDDDEEESKTSLDEIALIQSRAYQ